MSSADRNTLTTETGNAIIPLLLTALTNASVGVVLKDTTGDFLYIENLPDYFPQMDPVTARDESLFGADWAGTIQSVGMEVLADGAFRNFKLTRHADGELLACECTISRYALSHERYGVLIVISDLTAERKREDALKALLRELSHRSKNLLAIVQSIASQTARTSGSMNVFLTKFRGRIASLSSSQDLVTDSNWRGARLFELANRQFARYLDEGEKRVTVDGDDVLLSANAATHIGLALHELIVNSTSYGALSGIGGSVRLSSRQTVEPNGLPLVEIFWEEHLGVAASARPVNDAGKANRFGSTVLERVVPAAVGGKSQYDISENGTLYRLAFMDR